MKKPLKKRVADKVVKTKNGTIFKADAIELVKSIPDDEGIVIWVFKPKRRINYKYALLNALERAKVDTEATIPVDVGRHTLKKKRINILTWGMETATNAYAHCQHTIFPTVLRRTHADIGAWMCGQMDNLFALIDNKDIKEVTRSEMAHCLYQAARPRR